MLFRSAVAAKGLYDVLSPEQKYLADSRIVTLVAPAPRPTRDGAGANLPDLGGGSGGRLPR